MESAADDPMAILLTLAFVELLAGGLARPTRFALSRFWQFADGTAID